jgi:hypothetical protein
VSLLQIHLNKKGCSGRGVRYRILTAAQLEQNELAAVKTLDEGFTGVEYTLETGRLGLLDMVTHVTEAGLKTLDAAKWMPLANGTLTTQWSTYFNTRDTMILKRVFQAEHGVSQAEVDDILSGKVEVLED